MKDLGFRANTSEMIVYICTFTLLNTSQLRRWFHKNSNILKSYGELTKSYGLWTAVLLLFAGCVLTTSRDITVNPTDADVHIGIADTPYSILEVSAVNQLSNCTTLPGPASRNTEVESDCQPGATGRYVYVYMNTTALSTLNIFEVWIYGDRTGQSRK